MICKNNKIIKGGIKVFKDTVLCQVHCEIKGQPLTEE